MKKKIESVVISFRVPKKIKSKVKMACKKVIKELKQQLSDFSE
jgi:hypothetical protein